MKLAAQAAAAAIADFNVLRDRPREQRAVLGEPSDLPPPAVIRCCREVHASDAHRPAGRLDEFQHQGQQAGLTGAVAADQGERVAWGDGKVSAVDDRLCPAGVGDRDNVEQDGEHARHARGPEGA
jgi:hypothetical protein